jgi:polyisoprenoid-binding protein YceI
MGGGLSWGGAGVAIIDRFGRLVQGGLAPSRLPVKCVAAETSGRHVETAPSRASWKKARPRTRHRRSPEHPLGDFPMNALSRLAAAALVAATFAAQAAPVTYDIDPQHTYPSFEADHMGISTWRGKFDRTSGTVTMDREAGTGSVKIVVDMASGDFGLEALNKVARGKELFESAKYPKATFKGTLQDFVDGAPTKAVGTLEMHGKTNPVTLDIRKFKCIPHPMLKREDCGADVYATIDREQFGMDAGKAYGFSMAVDLRIQVEAIATK